jgi:hypothetical protein
LLARDIGVRATIDIDLYHAVTREVAEADLRRAASLDLGDWFRFERHGAAGTPSTRYRDLVDLAAIVLAASVEAEAQVTALRSEAQRRGLQLPGRFAVPDRGLWQPGYAAEAGRSLLPMARTLDEAIATVTPFLDPLLDAAAARSRWDPQNARWVQTQLSR